MTIKLTQTLIKQINANVCPRKWYEIYVAKTAPRIFKESFNKGMYFEQQVVGSSAHGMGVAQPKLLSNGNKAVAYQRIDDQAYFAKGVVFPLFEVNIKNVQETINTRYISRKKVIPAIIELEGTLDIIADMHDKELAVGPRESIIDLKVTSDINSTYGEYAWGAPLKMDHTQAYFYSYLLQSENYHKIYGSAAMYNFDSLFNLDWITFYYMVFDYKPVPEYKVFRKKFDKAGWLELEKNIEMAIKKYIVAEQLGFPETPGVSCADCTIKMSCKSYKPIFNFGSTIGP